MNENETIATLRRIAKDLNEIGYSEATKIDVKSLVSSGPNSGGGILNRWFNQEQDSRRKAVLFDLTQLVARVYSRKSSAIENAGKLIPGLCDRIDIEPAKTQLTPDELKYQRAIELFQTSNIPWTDITEQMGEPRSDWRSFQASVKRFATKSGQELPKRKPGARRKK